MLPDYMHLMEDKSPSKRKWIAIRESLFAFAFMVIFFFVGNIVLNLLGVTKTTVMFSGAIILFLIAVEMIFHDKERIEWEKGSVLMVPVATPMIAGPSCFAVIMVFAFADDITRAMLFGSMAVAWFTSALVFFFAHPIHRLIGDSGLVACKRLMGLLIALIAAQFFLEGIRDLIEVGA